MPKTVDGVALYYIYRDASNYKANDQIMLAGTFTDALRDRLTAALEDGDGHFIPEQVDLRCLVHDLPGEYDDDHAWHEIDPTEFYPIEVPPGTRTIEDFVTAMEEAKVDGWNPGACETIA